MVNPRKQIVKMIKVVKDKHLFKQCNKCDSIKNISEYSHVSTIGNLVYTHGKCKHCRKIQGREYKKRLAEENELIEEDGYDNY